MFWPCKPPGSGYNWNSLMEARFDTVSERLVNRYLEGHPDALTPDNAMVREWLDKNGVVAGATSEQAAQILANAKALNDKADKIDLPINVKWYGAKGDGATDDTAAIQAAIDAAFAFGKMRVYFPSGIYKTTAPLLLTTSTNNSIVGQRWWDGHGVQLVGDSRSTSIITKTNNSTWTEPSTVMHETEKERAFMQDVPIDSTLILSGLGTGVKISELYIKNESTSSNAHGIYGSRSRSCLEHLNVNAYHGINLYSFFNTIRDIRYNCRENALTIGQGTSSVIETMFVSGCKNPYVINSSYTNVNNLAADACTGTIYNFTGLGLVMNACGAESPAADYIVATGYDSSVTVNGLHCWRQTGSNAAVMRFNGPASICVNNLSILDNIQLSAVRSLVSVANASEIEFQLNGFKTYQGTGINNSAFTRLFDSVPAGDSAVIVNALGMSGAYKVNADLSLTPLQVKATDVEFITPSTGRYVDVPQFTNKLSVNDTDYADNYRFSGSGQLTADTAYWVSGYIPVSAGDIVRVRYADTANAPHLDTSAGNVWARPVLVRYDSSKNMLGNPIYEATGVLTIDADHLGFSYTVASGVYSRVSGRDTAANTILTVNEEIKSERVWQGEPMQLVPYVKVSGENVVITAPNGTNYTLSVDDSGNLSAIAHTGG